MGKLNKPHGKRFQSIAIFFHLRENSFVLMETKFAAVNSRHANYYVRICNMINKENKTKKTSNMNGLKKLSCLLLLTLSVFFTQDMRAQSVAVKTNLIYDATANFTIGSSAFYTGKYTVVAFNRHHTAGILRSDSAAANRNFAECRMQPAIFKLYRFAAVYHQAESLLYMFFEIGHDAAAPIVKTFVGRDFLINAEHAFHYAVGVQFVSFIFFVDT